MPDERRVLLATIFVAALRGDFDRLALNCAFRLLELQRRQRE